MSELVTDPAVPGASKRRAAIIGDLMREARRTGSLGTLHNRAAADQVGINQTDWDCLDVLDWAGPITAGELAKHVGLTSGAITGVLDRLERLGLARRVADPDDRRRVIIELERDSPRDPRWATVYANFGVLAEEMAEINERFDDEQLETVLDWVRLGNDAVERSIRRLRRAD